MTTAVRRAVPAGVVALFVACSESTPTQPTAAPNPADSPTAVKAREVSTAFGFVYEHTASGPLPLRNFPLAVHGSNATGVFGTVDVVTDATGRYEVPDLRRQHLTVTARPQNAYVSPCGVVLWGWDDEAYNLHVTSRANLPVPGTFTWIPPLERFPKPAGYGDTSVQSGTVTEMTPNGVRPVAEALVEISFIGESLPLGYTLTRGDGFYDVCVHEANDFGQELRVQKAGYRTATKRATWSLVNFELTRE